MQEGGDVKIIHSCLHPPILNAQFYAPQMSKNRAYYNAINKKCILFITVIGNYTGHNCNRAS
jgi:hypothetical protein